MNPLNLIAGAAGGYSQYGGGSGTPVSLAPAGVGHPVTAGASFPYTPEECNFGATVTGVNSSQVLATFANGNPAIIASTRTPVPVSVGW